jgi:uncharacterized membrane protein HdeD (DUF308 family)
METVLERHWKALALRGLVAIAFGLAAIMRPAMTLWTLVLLFGAYAIADGVLAIASGITLHPRNDAWILLLDGAIGVIAGIVAFIYTGMTALVLVDLIALWGLATGVLELILAFRLRHRLPSAGLLSLAGGASIALGVAILAWPAASAVAIILLIGSYAIVFGAACLLLAVELRRYVEGGRPRPA